MSSSSILRFSIFIASVCMGVAGIYMIKADNWAGLLVGFSCMVVAVSGLVVSVFRMPVLGKALPDSGFGVLSERQGNAFGSVLVFLFGILLIFLAARGVYTGAMPAPGSGPDILFSQAPFRYLLSLAVWGGGGIGLVWLSCKVAGQRNTKDNRAAGRVKSTDA